MSECISVAGGASPEDRDDAALTGRVSLSVDIEDDDRAAEVHAAFEEFGAEKIAEG